MDGLTIKHLSKVSDKKKRLDKLRKMHPDLNVPDEDVKREEGKPSFNDELKNLTRKDDRGLPKEITFTTIDRVSDMIILKPDEKEILITFINFPHFHALGVVQGNQAGTLSDPIPYSEKTTIVDRLDNANFVFFEYGLCQSPDEKVTIMVDVA